MLDIEKIRDHPKEVATKLKARGEDVEIEHLLELDEERRRLIGEVEELRRERNENSEKIGKLKAEGKEAEAEDLIERMGKVSSKIDKLEEELTAVESELEGELALLPNLPHDSVPVSSDEDDKEVIAEYGEKPSFDFKPKNHLEIGEELDLFKFEKASKIAGSRFPFYYGDGALLEMGLINFMYFYQVEENDYTPVFPPYLARGKSYYTSGQLPKFEEDLYRIDDRAEEGGERKESQEKLYLNPTAESILVNYYRDEILAEVQLPEKMVAFTTCFRREAGSYGEEERGLIRTHQFNKVELFRFVKPDNSYRHLEELILDAEGVLQELDLHYRKVLLPTCDLAQQSSKTVDLEVWIPSQETYQEVSSISNCEEFQARRGSIRYRPKSPEGDNSKQKPEYLHTLNGSGLATSRLMVALLENNQNPDGSIDLPEELTKYVKKDSLQ
ncbi:MAG: serine--tRNA ligase [Candidatus Bipolaricaulota bacterium]|nr:serine--tRNA ligase [Candidatus Bipolaricaulota bacterium]MBS3791803.1 serine--tRNA ligase [Candidatus Bipolaricaulota bacterium]